MFESEFVLVSRRVLCSEGLYSGDYMWRFYGIVSVRAAPRESGWSGGLLKFILFCLIYPLCNV